MQLALWDIAAKRCCACGRVLPLTDFNRRRRAADGRQAQCRECTAKYHAEHRDHHNKQIRARTARIRAENKQRLLDYLRQHPCVDCGETDTRVLEFDHLRDKVDDISRLLSWRSWDGVLEEIAKCDVVCANCHRRRTYARSNAYRARAYEKSGR